MEEMQWAEKVFLNEIHNQSQASITTVKPFPETTDIVIKKTAQERKKKLMDNKTKTSSLAQLKFAQKSQARSR